MHILVAQSICVLLMPARLSILKVNYKLQNRGVPVYVVRMLLYWQTYEDFIVRWNNTLSSSFKLSNGVRQGGILSPRLFSVYIDDLSKALVKPLPAAIYTQFVLIICFMLMIQCF